MKDNHHWNKVLYHGCGLLNDAQYCVRRALENYDEAGLNHAGEKHIADMRGLESTLRTACMAHDSAFAALLESIQQIDPDWFEEVI